MPAATVRLRSSQWLGYRDVTVLVRRSQVSMRLLEHMHPRDHRAAARTVTVLCAVAVVVTVAYAPLAAQQGDAGPWPLLLAGATVVLVAVMSCLAHFFSHANTVAWAACPLLAVAAIVVIDLLTHDASVAAQIFFLFRVVDAGIDIDRVATDFPLAGRVGCRVQQVVLV